MEPVSEFLHMGGYALFVWPAFAVAAVVLSVLLVWSIRDLRRERDLLESRPRRRSRAQSAEIEDDS